MEVEEKTERRMSESALPLGRPRILLVDDTPANIVALEAVLDSNDYALVAAGSGSTAVSLCQRTEFAAILLDVQMPGMDGFETARGIRSVALNARTPILMVTAIDRDDVYIEKGYEVGAIDYLTKPINPKVLKPKVECFVDLFRERQKNKRQADLLQADLRRERDEVLESALDAVVGADERDKVVYWNRRAEAMFGWSKFDALGCSMSSLLIPARYREKHLRGLRKFLETGEGPMLNRRIEVPAVRRDGSELPVELTVTAIKTADGYSFYSFLRDLTERKKAELELRESTAGLKQSEEALRAAVQARDEFLTIASHELKTPLTSLKLQLQIVARRLKKGDSALLSPDALRDIVETSTRQVNRLSYLIEDMLDGTRAAAGRLKFEFEECDSAEIVREACAANAPQFIAAKVPLDVAVEQGMGLKLRCDRGRLEQVVANLLTNALKYGEGKPVRVSIRKGEADVRISVADQGMGIAPENHERIFRRFERAVSASSISGLGLGLYISREIVRAHGGEILVESEPDKGSTFTVRLPAQPA